MPHSEQTPHDNSDSTTNLAVFDSPTLVSSYDPDSGVSPAELSLIETWVLNGSDVLDLGVGTGRTYPALSAKSRTYVGVDFAPAMVDASRRRFPDGDFRVGDAADLSAYDNASFDVVMFSYNGLDYLSPIENRQKAISEIHRVLRPGGRFILSTHNPRAIFIVPRGSTEDAVPADRGAQARRIARNLGIASVGSLRAATHLLRSHVFWSGSGYAVDRLNPLVTYYATSSNLTAELTKAGFNVEHILGSDHPRPLNSLVSPWTYVVGAKSTKSHPVVDSVSDPLAQSELHDEWDGLLTSTSGSTFQTREWVGAWKAALAPDSSLVILVARDPETSQIVGLFPLAWMSRHLHRRIPIKLNYLGIAGSGPGAGDHLGPIASDNETALALFAKAVEVAGKHPLFLESLSPEWSPLATTIRKARYVGTTICLASTRSKGQLFSDKWSRKFRKNTRRRGRHLHELGARFTWTPAGPGFPEALEILRQLHIKRWNELGQGGLFDATRFDFLTELASRFDDSERMWILVLETDDQPLGALLAFVSERTLSVYKTGWDPEFKDLSIGTALGAEAMRWAEERELMVFDYLRGPRGHKLDLGCVPIHDHSFLIPRGLSGRLLQLRERLSR